MDGLGAPWPGAIALSGGGDSLALMHLLAGWARARGFAAPMALVVDHALRAESASEARQAAAFARKAGLSAMRPLAPFPVSGYAGLNLARPLLQVSRMSLRAYLKERRQTWLEDPMNGEARFARSRIRRLMPALEAAGLSPARIADAAAHLARARIALDMATEAVLARVARPDGARLLLDTAALSAAPREIGLRALAALLMGVSGASYRPRFEALERLFDRIRTENLSGGATLHGCRLFPAPRAAQAFGSLTLILMKESSRRAAKAP